MDSAIDAVSSFLTAVHKGRVTVNDGAFYVGLLDEEVQEFKEAVAKSIDRPNRVNRGAALEEAADVVIVAIDLLICLGINPRALVDAVARKAAANLTKLSEDGVASLDFSGKAQKSQRYRKPTFDDLLD